MYYRDPYAIYSRFYDSLESDPKVFIKILKYYIDKYKSNAKKVLEIACGTGNILKCIKYEYEVEGLDISEGMLTKARERCQI